jgi:hypothetical protein
MEGFRPRQRVYRQLDSRRAKPPTLNKSVSISKQEWRANSMELIRSPRRQVKVENLFRNREMGTEVIRVRKKRYLDVRASVDNES